MNNKFALLIFIAFLLHGCVKKDNVSNEAEADLYSIDNLEVKPGFNFATSFSVQLKVTTLDNNDNPVPGIRINIYSAYEEDNGSRIASFVTGSDGAYSGTIGVPALTDSLVIETAAIGFVNRQKKVITGGKLDCVLGGSHPANTGRMAVTASVTGTESLLRVAALAPIVVPGSFNSLGVPNYLETPNDVVDAALITDMNTALPENRPVPTYHPQYLSETNQTNLEVQLPSQIWVTFLHEGAGYRNVLGYYTYELSHPPASANDIDSIHIIFPNTSYLNSGGGLVSGNKVKLGTFQPGTGIGWVLIANGYNGSTITNGTGVYYSDAKFNPETDPGLKKHCILLNDMNREKLILSFEDLNRQNGSDNDFNDVVFYVTADPIQAINTANIVLPAYTTLDADGDGVTDNFDDYPQDASKAFNNYYPAQNKVGTLAFEDLWPSKGDYDFNDMVVDYHFNPVTNAGNQVVQINAAITVRAIGAGFHSGFGIQLPVDPDWIASVTGTHIKGTLIRHNANGTEASQSLATIIVFDDAFNELKWPGGQDIGVNTTIGATYVQPQTLNLVITLKNPVNASLLGLPPYNPFIFVNKDRGREVHLINHIPTDLATRSLLGTGDDKSNSNKERYYLTGRNLPFAIDISSSFDYPVEKSAITSAHLKFFSWASSAGLQYADWYKPNNNYRNSTKIFSH